MVDRKIRRFSRIWWDFSPKGTFWSPSHRRWILTFKDRAVPWSRSPIVTETNKNGCCTDQSCLAMAIQQRKSTETYRNTPCDAETTRSPAEIAATGVPCLAAGYSPDIAPALPGRTTQKACGRNCRGSDSSPNSDVSVEKKGKQNSIPKCVVGLFFQQSKVGKVVSWIGRRCFYSGRPPDICAEAADWMQRGWQDSPGITCLAVAAAASNHSLTHSICKVRTTKERYHFNNQDHNIRLVNSN